MDGESAVLDFSTMETPAIESTAGEETSVQQTQETNQQETSQETQRQETQQTEEQKVEAGKPAPLKAIRDAVKAFEAANPELGKHLKTLLDNEGRIRAYQETYPDVETARTVKAAIDALGGMDGVTELSALKDHVDDINAKWDAGDPAALETLFEDGGEGAVKILPHYMNRAEKANPQAFGEAVRPHLVRSLQASNFEGVLSALMKETADKPAAKDIVDSIVGWYNDQKRLSEKSNLDALAPEREKLDKQRGELSQKEYKLFESEVGREVTPHIHKTFSDNMKSYLANDTRPLAAKQDIARAWLSEMGKAMEKDQKQIAQMLKSKSRNKDGIVNFAKTRVNAVAKQVTDEIVKRYGLKPGKAATQPAAKPGEEPPLTGNGSSPKTPIRVKDRPSDDSIDWDVPDAQLFFVSGVAKLKTGSKQWVKWR